MRYPVSFAEFRPRDTQAERLERVEAISARLEQRMDRVERAWVKPNELAALISRAKVLLACVALGLGGVVAGSFGTLLFAGVL